MQAQKLLIHCALNQEAKCLIESYRLKRDFNFPKFELFSNDHIDLLVSGIGGARTSTALGLYFGHSQASLTEIKFAINLGTAGACDKYDIGQCVLANKITNLTNHKSFYPDLLIRHSFAEAELKTFAKSCKISK